MQALQTFGTGPPGLQCWPSRPSVLAFQAFSAGLSGLKCWPSRLSVLALQPFSAGPPCLVTVLTSLYLKHSCALHSVQALQALSAGPPAGLQCSGPAGRSGPHNEIAVSCPIVANSFKNYKSFPIFSGVPLGFNSCARPSCIHGNACSPGLNSCAKFCYDLPSTGIHRNIIKVAHICQKLSIVAINNPKLQ